MENETVDFYGADDVDEGPHNALELGAQTSSHEGFLAHLDTVFLPLMQFCAESCTAPIDQAPVLETFPVLTPTPEQMLAQQAAALEQFRSQRMFSPPKIKAGKTAPRKGEGRCVYRFRC